MRTRWISLAWDLRLDRRHRNQQTLQLVTTVAKLDITPETARNPRNSDPTLLVHHQPHLHRLHRGLCSLHNPKEEERAKEEARMVAKAAREERMAAKEAARDDAFE